MKIYCVKTLNLRDPLDGKEIDCSPMWNDVYLRSEVDALIASRNEQINDYQEQVLASDDEIVKLREALRCLCSQVAQARESGAFIASETMDAAMRRAEEAIHD